MTDAEILALLAARDEQVLAEVSDKYRSYCFSIMRNVLENDEDCEECLNDLLLRLWNYPEPEKIVSLRQFIGAAARNLALDRYRQAGREKRGGSAGCEALEEFERFLPGGDVESVLENKELAAALNGFLRSVDLTERSIFIRRYYYLESTETLALRFGLKNGAILRRLSRTRKKLKTYLEKEGFKL